MESFTSVKTSPISILDTDILWSIFCYNTNLDSRPLITARHTSQVCKVWRDLILQSPTIWGNILDLQDLKSKKWRDEVIKRAGTAPLTIRGLITNSTMVETITGWLNNRWKTRIRVLDVWAFDTNLYTNIAWNIILTPSLVLESFRMEPCPAHLKNATQKGRLLFGNNAPRLRELHCPGYYPDVKASAWARSLTSVTLGYPFGISHLLETLSLMPCLRSIIFEGTGRKLTLFEEEVTAHPRTSDVFLPRLKEISMDRSFDLGDNILILLQKIFPAENCSLTIPRLHFQPTSVRGQSIFDLDYKSTISRCAKNTFFDRRVRSLGISAWAGTFIITARHDTDIFDETSSQNSPFQLTINDHDMTNYAALFSGTLHPFFIGNDSGGICEITALDFILENDLFPTSQFPAYSFAKNIERDLENIPKSFHQVMTLRASETTLSFLLDMCKKQGIVVFPMLDELRLASKTDIHGVMQILKAFLINRRDSGGKLMSMIDITEYASYRRNWGFLEEFKGVTVVWTKNGITSKYVCGWGDPKRLFL